MAKSQALSTMMDHASRALSNARNAEKFAADILSKGFGTFNLNERTVEALTRSNPDWRAQLSQAMISLDSASEQIDKFIVTIEAAQIELVG